MKGGKNEQKLGNSDSTILLLSNAHSLQATSTGCSVLCLAEILTQRPLLQF